MSMFFNQNKRKRLHQNRVQLAAVPLFRGIIMAAVTSRQNTL